jgi:hypothetical protein
VTRTEEDKLGSKAQDDDKLDTLREARKKAQGLINGKDSISIGGDNTDYRNFCLVTDKRVCFVINGDRGEEVPIECINEVEVETYLWKHVLKLSANNYKYQFQINGDIDSDEVKDCGHYLKNCVQNMKDEGPAEEGTMDGLSPILMRSENN